MELKENELELKKKELKEIYLKLNRRDCNELELIECPQVLSTSFSRARWAISVYNCSGQFSQIITFCLFRCCP